MSDCYTKREADLCESRSVYNVWFNGTCYNSSLYDNNTSCLSVITTTASYNCTPNNWLNEQISRRTSATEEYFKFVFTL